MSVNPMCLPGVFVLTVFLAAFPATAEEPPTAAPAQAAESPVAPGFTPGATHEIALVAETAR
jgi:hypothetical protein